MAFTRTAKGTAISKASGTTLALASVALAAGSSLVVGVAHDPVAITTVKWGTTDLVKDREETFAGNVQGSIWSLHNASASTQTITVTFDSAITAKALFAIQVVADKGPILTDVFTSAQGTSASPSSGSAGSQTYQGEFAVGLIGTEGPLGDSAGTWDSSYSNGQRNGTTGSTPDTNITISEGYYTTQIATGTTASKTGITSVDWVALVVTYKEGAPEDRTTQVIRDVLSKTPEAEVTQFIRDILQQMPEAEVAQVLQEILYVTLDDSTVMATQFLRDTLSKTAAPEVTQILQEILYVALNEFTMQTTQMIRDILYIEGEAPPSEVQLWGAIV